MLRRSPRAALLWCAAALVVVVTSLTVAGDLAALHRKARALGPPRVVVLATRDLALGTTVTRDAVTVRRVHESLPPGALRDASQVVGRVVAIPVLRGGIVVARHVTPRDRRGLDGVVPRGLRAVRIVVDDGLRPSPGQLADVIATFDPAKVSAEDDPTVVVAPAALVLAADDGGGGRIDQTKGSGGRVGVTVLVTPDQARRVAFATANGVLTLALVPPEDAQPHVQSQNG